jgi:hypothetical protein
MHSQHLTKNLPLKAPPLPLFSPLFSGVPLPSAGGPSPPPARRARPPLGRARWGHCRWRGVGARVGSEERWKRPFDFPIRGSFRLEWVATFRFMATLCDDVGRGHPPSA